MKFNMLGNADHTGPVKLSDTYTTNIGGADSGIAPSQTALYSVYNMLESSKVNKSDVIAVAQGGTGVTSIDKILAGRDGDGNTISSTYLKLSGGTLTGNLTIAGQNLVIGTTDSQSNDSGDIVWSYGDGSQKMRIWSSNEPTAAVGPNFRIYDTSGTSLYSGQLALANGANASGTWAISISGNAASATKATKATQDGNGSTISSTYLKLTGGTLSGGLTLSAGSVVTSAGNLYAGTEDETSLTRYVMARSGAGTIYLYSDASTTGNRGISSKNHAGTSKGILAVNKDNTVSFYGNAASATKLATARTIRTSLDSTSTASFDGSANVTPGITGTLAVGHGGTGVTSNPSMLTNLGSTSAASVFAASPRPGITGTLAIGHGGTGSTTAADARSALGCGTAATYAATTSVSSGSSSLVTSGGVYSALANKVIFACNGTNRAYPLQIRTVTVAIPHASSKSVTFTKFSNNALFAIPYCNHASFATAANISLNTLSNGSITLYQFNDAGATMQVQAAIFGF